MPATPRACVSLLLAAATPLSFAATEPAVEPGPAYLVYAGPYSSSPSSAFGRLFVVLADHADDAPPLWRVVTFNAVTFDADPLRYLTVGIMGGFLGRFDRRAFHEKARDYEDLDDRDLWPIELRLTREQRVALEEALGRSGWHPYSFFRLNCAYYVQAALARATGAVPEPSGIVSPAGVFDEVRRSELAGTSYFRPSATRGLAALAAYASPSVQRRLRTGAWMDAAADIEWLSSLSRPERAHAQAVFALRSLHGSAPLSPRAREGLATLRLLNAEPSAPAVVPVSGPGVRVVAPEFHRYPRFRVLYSAPDGSSGRMYLRFRGAMHDDADPWVAQPPASTMELLGATDGSVPGGRRSSTASSRSPPPAPSAKAPRSRRGSR